MLPRPTSLLALAPITLALLFAPGCAADGGDLDENGKPTLDGTGYQETEGGKADGLSGRRGPNASFDNGPTQVWSVSRDWSDRDSAAGLAWGANSGLSWDEKFSAWVDSLERNGDDTFVLTTPYHRNFDAPDLECAETAMFLRIAFANWYELPFFMEAADGGKRIYFGHMGIITSDGDAWGQMPNFKTRYPDFSSQEAQVMADPSLWPEDAALRGRKIGGNSSDAQTAFDDAHAGTYFDEIFLNKRVGYFLTIQLAFLGSMNLADSANTFNLKPASFKPGDFLVERFNASGIGHTIVIKEVRDLDGTIEIDGTTVAQREAEVISGSMPRRQGDWEGPTPARFYFLNSAFGGEGSVEFGAGLKRFRSPVEVDGKWTNVVLNRYSADYVNSNRHDELVARQDVYAELMPQLDPAQRMVALLAKVESDREWLRDHPSSCSARTSRETFFNAVYEAGEALGMSKTEVDAQHRTLEDYVFAELVYDVSKTCCWNSSTNEMYQVAMKYNECLMGEATDSECDALDDADKGMCQPARVFMNRDDSGDGYKIFADFAAANGKTWVAWSADESCQQAGVAEDTQEVSTVTDYCALADVPEPEPFSCDTDQFQCDVDRCVSSTWVCDDEVDCNDGTDEQGCDS
jgi:hypothetical protein